jgi:ubiquitin-protein ligase
MEWIDKMFSEFVEDQARLVEMQHPGAENHDIYDKRLTEPDPQKFKEYRDPPYSMYFYYVRVNNSGRLVIDHYFYANGDEDDPTTWEPIRYDENVLRGLVTRLANNARPTGPKKPPRIGKGNFNKTPWVRKAYVAIFLEEANWNLRKKPSDGSESAITFIVEEGNKVGLPNHSFFDAIDLAITMPIRRPRPGGPTEDTRSAIVFVNHMKRDEDGIDLGHEDPNNSKYEKQEFVFKLIVNVNAEMPDDPPTVFIIDPGGTNEGPPLPPPPEL